MKEYTEKYFLSAGEANAEDEMALPLLVTRLIDIATAHANALGIGNPNMPSPDMGWVLSRLTVEMNRYPRVDSNYSITTWVEGWNRHFSLRCFAIEDEEGNVLGYARSIWMVLNTTTRANAGLGALPFDMNLISKRECPIAKQAKHVDFHSAEPEHYRFKYCDLDHYRHVNTVRYISLLLNRFPLEMYDAHRVHRLELSFLHEARYGMEVAINHHIDEQNPLLNSFFLQAEDAESTPILYARILFAPRG